MRNYNPSLIRLLEDDHKRLVEFYLEVKSLFEKDIDFDILADKLDDLKSLLVMHVNFENTLLYSYLEEKYKNSDDKLVFIEEADKEMQNIISVAMKFIQDCSCYDTLIKHRDDFIKELDGIGDVLVERIKFEEEQLYSLYNPHVIP